MAAHPAPAADVAGEASWPHQEQSSQRFRRCLIAAGEQVTLTGFGSVLLPWALPWAAGLTGAAFAAKPVARALIWTVTITFAHTVMPLATAVLNAR